MRIITSLLFIAVLCFALSGCSIKMVEIKTLDNFKVNNALSDPEINFDLQLYNPNPFGLTIKEMKTFVMMGDSSFSTLSLSEKKRIAAHGETSIPFTYKPSGKNIGLLFSGGLQGLLGNHPKTIKVNGEVVLRKFIFSKTYRYQYPK